MENENLITKKDSYKMKISQIRKELNEDIMSCVNYNNLFGEYLINEPFEVEDVYKATAFEVEWLDFHNEGDGKTIYFYLEYLDGDQADGKYIYEMDIASLECFFNDILITKSYSSYS